MGARARAVGEAARAASGGSGQESHAQQSGSTVKAAKIVSPTEAPRSLAPDPSPPSTATNTSAPPAMATTASLPAELVREIVSLAYPPGEPGSGRGLRRTSLVHSTWLQPSISVMTEKLSFAASRLHRLHRFMEEGPMGFACLSLRFVDISSDDICVVLSKARPGSIESLDVTQTMFQLSKRLFVFTSLRSECLPWPVGDKQVG